MRPSAPQILPSCRRQGAPRPGFRALGVRAARSFIRESPTAPWGARLPNAGVASSNRAHLAAWAGRSALLTPAIAPAPPGHSTRRALRDHAIELQASNPLVGTCACNHIGLIRHFGTGGENLAA